MATEAAQAVEPVLDAASEAILEGIDGTVEVLDKTTEIVRNNPVVLAVVAGVAGAAGAVGGYFFAKKRLKAFYEDLATEEIAEAKVFYAKLNKINDDGDILTPQQVMEQRHGAEAAKALLKYQGDDSQGQTQPAPDEQDEALLSKTETTVRELHAVSDDGKEVTVTEVEETVNVFNDPTFDLEEELKFRDEEKPYIITHDEYFEGEKNYDTISLTYYETDGVLTDERDQPIDETDSLVGDEHLVRFGHGSKDRNIVYVRNDKLATDYEIVRSTGSYLEEVLGMIEDEPNSLKHSDQRDRRRAFRHGEG